MKMFKWVKATDILLFVTVLSLTFLIGSFFTGKSQSSEVEPQNGGVPILDPLNPCGPTSLVLAGMLCGRENISLEMVRQYMDPDHLGRTSMADILRASDELGLHTKAVQFEPRKIRDLSTPVILHMKNLHFLVVVSNRSGELLVLDPPHKHRKAKASELSQQSTGKAILVSGSSEDLAENLSRLGLQL